MVIQAYRTQPYATTHENRIFDALLVSLEEVWGNSEDLVLLLGNFQCQGSEIDAAVLKRGSITVIDFKDYGGLINISENGRWLADETEIKGGNKPNPFIQIKDNKFALLKSLEKISFLSGNQPNLGHISGLVLFHKSIIFNDKQLPPNVERWFHVVDFDHAVERLSQITSREISLSNQDLEYLAKTLSIPEYTPIGSGIKAITFSAKGVDTNEPELPDSLRPAISQVETFLDSSERIIIVAGMIGTGLEQLASAIAFKALGKGRNFSILAPNRRIALRYAGEVSSIYTHIYSANPRLEKEKFIYDLTENKDTEKQLYIISDAHLISDSKFETDDSSYGTGQLLTDFLSFADLKESKRQIIFLGDPFQLTRGKADESALCNERLQAITDSQAGEISLDRILPGNENDLFVRNCLNLAKCINETIFNQIYISTDALQVIEAPTEKELRPQSLHDLFIKDPKFTKYIAFSHAEVNRINSWLRQRVFGRGDTITAGDIVNIHNSFSVENQDDFERYVYVSNDSFAEVIAVSENVEPLVQPLKGRDQPVTVPFLRIQAKLLQGSKEIEFLCLKNYLYAEKPEVDTDTLIALHISAKARFRQYRKNRNETSQSDTNEEAILLARFLRNDPYLNAARLRFGYALTLHRAQGQQFKTVIANMDIGQGQTNEAYFRWVYTLFSVVQKQIILSNIPSITPFYKTIWDANQGKLDSIRPRDLIAFDSDGEAGTTNIPNLSIPEKALRNLYLHIVNILQPKGIVVHSYKHHNYQEVYCLKQEDTNASCLLRIHYNGKYQITRIEPVKSEPSEFATQVYDFITSGVRLETDFQHKIYDLMKQQLDLHKVLIQSIEHHEFQEIYYLKSQDDALKLQIFYDGDGFITRIIPAAYTDSKIAEEVRLALGV